MKQEDYLPHAWGNVMSSEYSPEAFAELQKAAEIEPQDTTLIPEGILVWEPFESKTPWELNEIIHSLAYEFWKAAEQAVEDYKRSTKENQ